VLVAIVSACAPTGSLTASEGWPPVRRTLAAAGASEVRRVRDGVAELRLSDPEPAGTSNRRAGWPAVIATEDVPTGSVLRSAGALPARTRDAGPGAAVMFSETATTGVAGARLSAVAATGIVRRTCGVATETARLPDGTATNAFTWARIPRAAAWRLQGCGCWPRFGWAWLPSARACCWPPGPCFEGLPTLA
jgi:hypothetical protein